MPRLLYDELRTQAATFKCLPCREFGIPNRIVVLAEVAEDQGLNLAREFVGDVFTCRVVGEMALAGEDALLDVPGIGTDFE